MEQIYVLRSIIEESIEFQQRLSISFIDFTKAFDSIDRVTLSKILRSYGIPEKFLDILEIFTTNQVAAYGLTKV